MALPERLLLTGATGSPYTRKMVALMRYRHIAHSILWGDPAQLEERGLPKPKVALHPTFFFPDENGELEAVVDSTPIIRRLEQEQAGR
ncbi:MAG: glutathione S-transferase N-terminal domain-containing protein [Gammaproteobacteria bacterium]|nr:glutathione S-transferase N-terminal domain-containing protein [Gammaproteobacteria bacterium]